MNTPYLIAMDAGGTKTDAVLFTPDGTVRKRILTHGINPFNSGFDTACGDCLDLLAQLKAAAPGPVAAAYVGMPASQYFGDRISAHIQAHAGLPRVRTEADGYMLISAMLGHSDGAALVCGTGSGLYIRNQDTQYSIGGWGYILYGCGSGFILGRRALNAVVRQADGRGERTLLTDLANAQIGGDVTQRLPEIYEGGRPAFAAFARTVYAARRAGDAVATRIFDECAEDLAEMVRTARQRSGIERLILNGGILQHFPEYVEALRQRIPAEITLIPSDVPPLYGAAREALYDAGLAAGDAFRQQFFATLGA